MRKAKICAGGRSALQETQKVLQWVCGLLEHHHSTPAHSCEGPLQMAGNNLIRSLETQRSVNSQHFLTPWFLFIYLFFKKKKIVQKHYFYVYVSFANYFFKGTNKEKVL